MVLTRTSYRKFDGASRGEKGGAGAEPAAGASALSGEFDCAKARKRPRGWEASGRFQESATPSGGPGPGRKGTPMSSTAEQYQAKADEALVQLEKATTDSERTRLKRARGVYLRLVNHGAEAAERAAIKPAPKIRPEKPTVAATPRAPTWTLR